ncbi:unnamed protein product [Adineta steineri]|uniref:Uncharacterized protein n=1 Tax=Adineta steineri TaxID=433720 RepID=A0A818KNC2_9BILA|nr:unnamed protein product [Adineta steineri]
MEEIQLKTIIYGSEEILESIELNLPIPMILTHDRSSLARKISNQSKHINSKLQRYFIILFESIENEPDNLYEKMEENSQVIAVFHTWNEDSVRTFKQTKVYNIRQDLLTFALTCSIIEYLKAQANQHIQLNQIPLSKIYMRQAGKIKEWLMSTIRAQPCHILVIPLNTNSTNLIDSIQCLQQFCKRFGYPSAIIRSLDDYIPKSEIYDKLPYGKLLFENENPIDICNCLRLLSPIRMYLYGNEEVIPSEWSRLMASTEVDHVDKGIVNDDDWCTFLENETVSENIKWNFSIKHGRSWKLTHLTPIQLHTLEDNIRFRSALRRSNMTFYSRMSNVTARLYDWFDTCLEREHLQHEHKLIRRDNSNALGSDKPEEQMNLLGNLNNTRFDDNKNNSSYSLPYSSHQSNEIVNYYSNKSDRTFIWLDNTIYSIENRFQELIYPDQWKYFSNIYDCEAFILKQKLQYNTKIYLFTTCNLAEQLFAYEHVSKIYAAYLSFNQNEIYPTWINNFPIIRGIYQNFDSLYEQFSYDITTNIELVPFHNQEQKNEDLLPISFLDTAGKGFERYRILTDILLKLPRTLEAKQEMIDELERTSNGNFSQQIQDFERNYHSNDAIQWYTRESFVYRTINQILRYDDISLAIKYRFFITDLYEKLSELHNQIIQSNDFSEQPIITCYRGQLMQLSEINQFKQNVGKHIAINTFFSTSQSLDIALMFAGGSKFENTTSLKSIIFSIEVDPSIQNTRPYAHINSYSSYTDEDEVLFALCSVFRIEKFSMLSVNDNIPVIHLKMIDESELPPISIDIPNLIPEKIVLDPVYAFVGIKSLTEETNEQFELIKSVLENVYVHFFDNIDDFDNYTKSIEAIQSFIVFVHSQSHMPENSQQIQVISYGENDTHFNDLIYQLLYLMESKNRLKEQMDDLRKKLVDIYCPSDQSSFYVQLLLSSSSKKESENELKTKFPSSTILPFYQIESCMYFLQSIIVEPSKLGNAILILQSDDTNIDNLIDQFENIDSIEHIYICSKDALNIKNRRIIHGKFCNEHDLYTQLYSDNLMNSSIQTNLQIDIFKKKNEAIRYFQQTEQFYKLLKEHQTLEKTNLG